MEPTVFKHKIAAEFMAAADPDGRRFGTGAWLRAAELLKKLPDGASAEDIRLALVPILATSPGGQEELNALFLEAEKRVAAFQKEVAEQPIAPPVFFEKKKKGRVAQILAGVVLIVLMAGLGVYFFEKNKREAAEQAATEAADTTAVVNNLQEKVGAAIPKPAETELFPQKTWPFPHKLTDFAEPAPPGWRLWMAENWAWFRWLMALVATALLAAVWFWRAMKNRTLIAEHQRPDKPPYFWNIEIPGIERAISEDEIGPMAQLMRRRELSENRHFDIVRTLEATIAAGGSPEFRFRSPSQPVDYLMLIDRQTQKNHRARLFDHIYRTLREQEVVIERFFFDSDLRLCFNEEHPEGVPTAVLAQKLGQSRLMLVGTGAQLLSPATGRLMPWAGLFSSWKNRAVFSPKPLREWATDEQRLAELFTTMPATAQAMRFWADELDMGEDARMENWKKQVHDAHDAPIRPDPADPMPVLGLYFAENALVWIASCAIFPALHWDLTLWLRLRIEHFLEKNAAPDFQIPQSEVSEIARLAWFAEGEMPPETRAALLHWLEKNHPATLARLRADLAALLEGNAPPVGSVAFDEYRMAVALNRWLTEADPKTKKQFEKEIAALLAAKVEADFTVIKYLDKPRSPMDFVVPERWKKFVHPGGMRGLGWVRKWKDLRWVLPVWFAAVWMLCVWNWDFLASDCPFAQRQVLEENGQRFVFCNDNPSHILLAGEREFQRDMLARKFGQIDTISTGLKVFGAEYREEPDPVLQRLLREVPGNIASDLYNVARDYFYKNQRDSACLFFRKAHALDSLDVDILNGKNLCDPPTVAAETLLPKMIKITGGTFDMGCDEKRDSDCSDDEKPVHRVTISGFYMGETEVTQAQWHKIMGNNPSRWKADNLPVEQVSWNDIQVFLKKLNELTGKKYRLPTEAEWEFAARGGTKTKNLKFVGSNDLESVAWFSGNSGSKTHTVGQKNPNELGLFDMTGNVWEWCSDGYGGYRSDAQSNPNGANLGKARVGRGGGYFDNPGYCRPASRYSFQSTQRSNSVGFRVAQDQ